MNDTYEITMCLSVQISLYCKKGKWEKARGKKYLLGGDRHTKNVLHPYHVPEFV